MSFKRFIIALLMGVLAGLACILISGGFQQSLRVLATIFTSRLLIGFVIGISGLKIGWALHGLLMGLVVSIPSGFAASISPPPEFGKWEMLAMWIVAGAIYGLIIELVTSLIFKAKLK